MFDNNDYYSHEDEDESATDNIFVIIIVDDIHYAIPVNMVSEILILPKVTSLPNSASFMKGIINLRGKVIPVSDTRRKFGLKTFDELDNEFYEMMMIRKKDHIAWIDELVSSIEENRFFKLATDPHQCAFGKWYDSYKPKGIALTSYLSKFDIPHKTIHHIAEKAFKLKESQGIDAAKALINNVKSKELELLKHLFDNIKSALLESRREIVVIINLNDNLFGFTADSSYTVMNIPIEKIKIEKHINNQFVSGVYSEEEDLIMVLDMESMVAE